VVNRKPVDATLPQPVTPPLNPFKFTINNIIRDLYYKVDNANINPNIFNLTYDEKDTFLDGTGGLVSVYNDYVNSIYSKNITFFCFNQNTITLPVINKTYKGYSNNILDFKIKNTDTSSWKVTTIDFADMVLGLDNSIITGKTVTNTIYKDQILSEALTVIDNSVLDAEINSFLKPPDNVNIETPNNVWALSRNLFFEVDVFEQIINNTETFIYLNLVTGYYFNPTLSNLLSLMGVEFNEITDKESEVRIYLLNEYDVIKKTNITKYRQIIDEITYILENDTLDVYRTKVLKYVNDNFTSANYPRYLTSYLNLIYKNNNDFNLADAKILSELDTELVKLKANEGFTLLDGFFENYRDLSFFFRGRSKNVGTEGNLKIFDVRDYVFDTILTVTGNKNVAVNGELSFSLKYLIGYKILQGMLNTKKITIKGKIKIGIENGESNKYLFVPINVTLNIGDKPIQSYLSEVTLTTSQLKI
jgi:hypothetical protein